MLPLFEKGSTEEWFAQDIISGYFFPEQDGIRCDDQEIDQEEDDGGINGAEDMREFQPEP